MNLHYDYNWVITGNSANKGRFREEGRGSVVRPENTNQDEECLRTEITQGIIDGYLSAAESWRKNPRYLGLTDLKVELGALEAHGNSMSHKKS